ncbi:uncharacterized protein [Anoplolepis gracilipes]|uniref:uncharacterized protein n=1 Tax=Anoplolepis gracilipes TaxID=354296 RepID=UPI003BA0EAE4
MRIPDIASVIAWLMVAARRRWEARNGDAVEGSYNLIEPNGVRRLLPFPTFPTFPLYPPYPAYPSYPTDPITGINTILRPDVTTAVVQAPIAVAVRPFPVQVMVRPINSINPTFPIIATNPGLVGVGLGPIYRPPYGSFYSGTHQAVVGNGGIVRVR